MTRSNLWLCDANANDLVRELEAGSITSAQIVGALLERIADIDAPESDIALRSVLALAPDALASAHRLDEERRTGTVRSRLHGIPVLIKDNIEALGLPATAGSSALVGRPVLRDAPLVSRLRDAGLVILGSTNLSQWANMRSPMSTSGWSAVGGLTVNPYRLDRCAGGSSSGSGAALAARLTPLAVGTETDGSITCPASLNGVVGLKPTVGAVPGEGVVPIAKSQDSAGPMARTVADVALLFEVLSGVEHVLDSLERGWSGLRVAVASNLMTGHPATDALFHECVRRANAAGMTSSIISVAQADERVGADEVTVLLSEMVDDLGTFLARRGGGGPTSLAQVVAFENDHADVELPYFGHEFFDQALESGGRASDAYKEARARNVAWAVDECLEPALADADCFIAPCYSPAWKNDLVLGGSGSARWSQVTQAPAIAGWPIATVPMGLIDGLPVGLAIVGRPGAETTLLAVASDFEKTLGLSLVPTFLASSRG